MRWKSNFLGILCAFFIFCEGVIDKPINGSNQAPGRIDSIFNSEIDTVYVGYSYSGNIGAIDPENDSIVYSISNSLASFTLLPNGDFTFLPEFADTGNQVIKVSVTDVHGASSILMWRFKVKVEIVPLVPLSVPATWVYFTEESFLGKPFIAETAFVSIRELINNENDTEVVVSCSLNTFKTIRTATFLPDSMLYDTTYEHKDSSYQFVLSISGRDVSVLQGKPGRYNPFWVKNSISKVDEKTEMIGYKIDRYRNLGVTVINGDTVQTLSERVVSWGGGETSNSGAEYATGYGLLRAWSSGMTTLISYNSELLLRE